MAFPINDSFNYTPKVPPETQHCPCYYQQLGYCLCVSWIDTAVAETVNPTVPEATSTPPSATIPAFNTATIPIPTDNANLSGANFSPDAIQNPNLPLYSQEDNFPDLFVPTNHHHHQPDLSLPFASPPSWTNGFHEASPAATSADLSSSDGSPAAVQSLAGSPVNYNYAMSPASSTFAWPGSGYGEVYSASPASSEPM